MRIKKFTVYGERCSGTNYIEDLIKKTFDLPVTWEYGWKHFFGFSDLENSDDCLFVAIVRNPYDWLKSLYLQKHHMAATLRHDFGSFLQKEWYSFRDMVDKVNGKYYNQPRFEDFKYKEIMHDRNLNTGERYKNVFEMRDVKNRFLYYELPKKVKNCCFITYDDLKNNPDIILKKMGKKFGLKANNVEQDFDYDPKYKQKFIEKIYHIEPKYMRLINDKLNWPMEKKMGFGQEHPENRMGSSENDSLINTSNYSSLHKPLIEAKIKKDRSSIDYKNKLNYGKTFANSKPMTEHKEKKDRSIVDYKSVLNYAKNSVNNAPIQQQKVKKDKTMVSNSAVNFVYTC